MSHPYPDNNSRYPPPGSSRRPYPSRADRDGRMYDDRSRSRSPGGTHSSPHDRVTTEMITAVDHHDRLHPGVGDRPTEIATARVISPPDITVGAGAIVGAAVERRIPRQRGTEAETSQISTELRNAYHVEGLEDIRVIRDRQTKVSRQLGFLRFQSIDASRAFLERNHPCIYLYGPSTGSNDRSTKVRIAYSREREDRGRVKAEGDWTCRMCAIVNYATRQKCFRCNAPRPEPGPTGPPGIPAPKVVNTGDNDAAPDNQPSQFLLFRGLESSVTEELFAKGVAKLYKPASGGSDNSANSQKKGAKVASTTGDANLGAREGSIRRVLLTRDRKTNESWRYGFAEFASVMDAQAAVTRLNSFDKFTISSRPVMVSYIHAGVFVPVMNPTASTDHFTFSPLNNPSLKLMYWDDEGYVTELTVTSSEEDGGQEQSKDDKPLGNQQDNKSSKDADKAKKRKADAAVTANAKKTAMPSHLQFWSNRHAELHGIHKKDDNGNPADAGSDGTVPADSAAPPTQSYADPNRHCCYLCLRQFKSAAEVNRHERMSQLHRDNTQNDELKSRAMGKLVKHGIAPPSAEYRDRARERRQAFGRTKVSTKQKPTPAKEEDEPPVQSTSKGASLLSKMGWSAGSGLGAQGTGVTAPIATEVYAQGVGLGAQGSKLGDAAEEAGRNTRGRYDEFLEKTKQAARQRYEQMDR
ncbi:rna-binding protein [Penicillium lagena]|uniref:rna-binding protein n=1 Tax=Penicillium lagena TaxID=94218 RepID=UPI0025423163|nr:rna-binding protein [Penicillium lagena]KAJ5624361.1 rna-binding protein [Penicillium lagena]